MVDFNIDVRVRGDQARRGTRDVNRELERVNRTAERTRRLLQNAFAFVGLGLGIQQLLDLSNGFTELSNRINIAQDGIGDVNVTFDRLLEISNRTRSPLEANVELFQRASIAADELGASQEQLYQFVTNVGTALAIQGGSASQASGAILQLSQALGSGIVRAEEFNSVLEGAFPIAQAAARGIDAAGGSVARLRSLIVEGKITSDTFFEGILSQSDQLAETFGNTSTTIGQAFTILRNNLIDLVRRFEESTGAITSLAEGLEVLANNLDIVSAALGLLAVRAIAPLVATYIPRLIALLATLRTALQLLAVSGGAAIVFTSAWSTLLAALGGPAGVLGLAAAGIAYLALRTDEYSDTLGKNSKLLKSNADLFDDLAEAPQEFIDAQIKATQVTVETTIALLRQQQALLESNTFIAKATLLWQEFLAVFGLGDGPEERFDNLLNQVNELVAQLAELQAAEGRRRSQQQEANSAEFYKETVTALKEQVQEEKTRSEILRITAGRQEAVLAGQEILNERQKEGIQLLQGQNEEIGKLLVQLADQIDETERLTRLYELEKDILREINGDVQEYTDRIKVLNELLSQGAIDQDQFNLAIARARYEALQTSQGIEAGLERGLLRLRIDSLETGRAIERGVVSAFDSLSQGIADLATNGSIDFTRFINSMIADLIRLSLQLAIVRPLLQAFGFNTGAGGTGVVSTGVGGAAGQVGGAPIYASGGYVVGPGTGTSDSIDARVSNGEFVVNAAATSRNLGLLQSINSGQSPGRSVVYAPTIQVSVEGGSGGEPDEEQADRIARRIEEGQRQQFNKFIVDAQRDGGLLSRSKGNYS